MGSMEQMNNINGHNVNASNLIVNIDSFPYTSTNQNKYSATSVFNSNNQNQNIPLACQEHRNMCSQNDDNTILSGCGSYSINHDESFNAMANGIGDQDYLLHGIKTTES